MNNMRYPLQDLFWECTLRCNAFCAFCGSRCGEVVSQELTTEQILAAFRDIAQHFDPRQIMINVTGGEPLLRKDLFDVMAVCTELGFSWGMVTNGILITPNIIERMRASGMKTISVSLDGLKETHEALRGVKNCYETILGNIRLLRDAAFLEHLQVTTVVSKKNIGELEALYEQLKTCGLHSWRVAIVDPIGRASDNRSLLLDKQELAYYLDFISTHHNDPVLPVVSTCSHYLAEHDPALGRRAFVCRAGKNLASILANGDIFVCPNVPRRPELIQGNVLTHSFARAWEKGFQAFRDINTRRNNTCAQCPDWIKCQGDSAHTWDYSKSEPLFCYRRFFPNPESAPLPTLDSIIGSIRQSVPRLRGICVRYGWENRIPVVFTPNASRELFHFFHWGQKHPQNNAELMAALIGHRLNDAVLVEFVSPVYLEDRNTKAAKFTETSLRSGIMETNAINLSYLQSPDLCLLESPCQLLGFVHSHPDDLDLFLSEGDVMLHRMLTKEGMDVSIIVNPQKRQIAAYHGNALELAEIRLLTQEQYVTDWDIRTT